MLPGNGPIVSPGLDLGIDMDSRRLIITFRSVEQATRYYQIVNSRDIGGILQCTVSGYDALLRLPSRVTNIVASTSCGGFYLIVGDRDRDLAQWWQREIPFWKFLNGSTRKIYLDRFITDQEINRQLSIYPPAPAPAVMYEPPIAVVSARYEPRPAQTSTFRPNTRIHEGPTTIL